MLIAGGRDLETTSISFVNKWHRLQDDSSFKMLQILQFVAFYFVPAHSFLTHVLCYHS